MPRHAPAITSFKTPTSRNSRRDAEFANGDWKAALGRMSGAYSANTIRSYRADFSIFAAWCKQEGHAPLPASPETVADFVTAQSESAAPATVNRRRASIAKIHHLLKLENPVRTEEVNLATRTMFRKKGRRQDQALGLTAALKHKIIDACPETPSGLRDRALIAVGYDTLCRRAELAQLLVDDLIIKTDGSGTILVRKAKSDQFGDGRLAYLSAEAIDHLKRWLHSADLTAGPIFRAIFSRRFNRGHFDPRSRGLECPEIPRQTSRPRRSDRCQTLRPFAEGRRRPRHGRRRHRPRRHHARRWLEIARYGDAVYRAYGCAEVGDGTAAQSTADYTYIGKVKIRTFRSC